MNSKESAKAQLAPVDEVQAAIDWIRQCGIPAKADILERHIAELTEERNGYRQRWADAAAESRLIEETLADERAAHEQTRKELHDNLSKADCYDRVCLSLGITNDIIGHVEQMKASHEQTEVERDAALLEVKVLERMVEATHEWGCQFCRHRPRDKKDALCIRCLQDYREQAEEELAKEAK